MCDAVWYKVKWEATEEIKLRHEIFKTMNRTTSVL